MSLTACSPWRSKRTNCRVPSGKRFSTAPLGVSGVETCRRSLPSGSQLREGGASIKMAMAEPTRCVMAYACIRSETARAPPSACSTAILSAVPIEQSKQCRPFPVQVDGIQICVVVVLLGRVLADFGRGQGHLLSHR